MFVTIQSGRGYKNEGIPQAVEKGDLRSRGQGWELNGTTVTWVSQVRLSHPCFSRVPFFFSCCWAIFPTSWCVKCEKVQTASKSEQVSINPNFKFGGKENQLAQFGPGILSSSNHLWPNRRDHMVQNGGRRVERRRGRGPPVFLNLRFSQNHVGAH